MRAGSLLLLSLSNKTPSHNTLGGWGNFYPAKVKVKKKRKKERKKGLV